MRYCKSIGVKTIITALFLFSSVQLLTAQSKLLQGRVSALNKDIIGVTIQNISTQKAAITDAEGNFEINVRLNDTLVFAAVQFKRKILTINSAVLNTSFIVVNLEEFVNELNEVTVQPFNLSGNLGSDVIGLSLEKDVSAEALGLPNADVRIISQSENKLNDADNGKFVYYYGIAMVINLNKILNRLSGRTKMLKERVALDKRYNSTKSVEENYLDSVLVSHLKIPEKNFYDFIYFCEVDVEFTTLLENNDELQLWQFLIEKSKVYRKNNGLD